MPRALLVLTLALLVIVGACSSGSGSSGGLAGTSGSSGVGGSVGTGGAGGSGATICGPACARISECNTDGAPEEREAAEQQCLQWCGSGVASPQCGDDWKLFAGCYSQHAGADCNTVFFECLGEQHEALRCDECGPPDASPKPGDACLATQEGEKRCYYCDTVIDCRFEDGYFLWRIFQQCDPYSGYATCTEDADGAHC